eukprot:8193864-Heterocapsa_arctica.AAC.1
MLGDGARPLQDSLAVSTCKNPQDFSGMRSPQMYMCTAEGGPFPGHTEVEPGLREGGRGEGGLAGSPEPPKGFRTMDLRHRSPTL